ncbi:MAG: hypothetical protein WAQ05_24460 [Rubrivivax sp.]
MLTNKNEVLAAALDQTNTWLAQTLGRPGSSTAVDQPADLSVKVSP